MARTSADDVLAELERTDFPTAQIEPSQVTTVGIDPATLLVDEELDTSDHDLSASRLEFIERYLAGHFILSSGIDDIRQTSSERTDREQKSYTGEFGGGLRSTTLGQKAIAMDTTGTLGKLDKPKAVITSPDAKGYEPS
jgi:hypothetical protein